MHPSVDLTALDVDHQGIRRDTPTSVDLATTHRKVHVVSSAEPISAEDVPTFDEGGVSYEGASLHVTFDGASRHAEVDAAVSFRQIAAEA